MIKAIIISKLILFDNNNELIEDNLWIVDLFCNNKIKLLVIARNNSIRIMENEIPQEYREKIKFIDRGIGAKNKINEAKRKGMLFGIIGIVEEDAIFSFNCQIPIFNPEKLNGRGIHISKKIIDYGLPILKFEDVIDCFNSYDIHENNYFHINFGMEFTVISLNNANTYNRPQDEKRIKEIFSTNLKGDKSTRDQRILLILLFHLINEVTTNRHFSDISYWGVFPSSKVENTDTSVNFLKEAVRVLVNGRPQKGKDVLIRHNSMNSKHSIGSKRLQLKCDNDFDTLIVNPELKGKLKGQSVCIIDDYITNGYSAEATKHLLFKAGVKKIIFISLGKFGKSYFSTDYHLEGDVFGTYTYKFIDEYRNYGNPMNYDLNNDKEILNFSSLLDI